MVCSILGQFLDILVTKGDKGVEIFIEVLEYDYPHVYKLITNKDAKEPPKSMYKTSYRNNSQK